MMRLMDSFQDCTPVVAVNFLELETNAVLHSNEDLIWCVKIGVYVGFWVRRGS